MKEYGKEGFKRLAHKAMIELMKEHPDKVRFAYYGKTDTLAYIPVCVNYPDNMHENYITLYAPPKANISVKGRKFKDIFEELMKHDDIEIEISLRKITKIDETRYLTKLYGKHLVIETPPELQLKGMTTKTFRIGEDGYPKHDGKRVRFFEPSRKELLVLLA